MLRPPENIYASSEPPTTWCHIVAYPDFEQKRELHIIPDLWHNLHTTKEVTAQYAQNAVTSLFQNWLQEAGQELPAPWVHEFEGKYTNTKDIYLYLIVFPNEDEYYEAETLIDHVLHRASDTQKILIREAENLYKYLLTYPQYEIIIPAQPNYHAQNDNNLG